MLYIVTPIFNRKEFTKEYLFALSKQTVNNFKVIIVDDGSSDGSSEMIERDFPNVIVLKEKGDLWWAEATNIGVRYAIDNGASFIMTLNDDTLPEIDYIEKMLFWALKKPSALLGAFAIDALTNEPIYGGEILNWKRGKFEPLLSKIPLEKRNGLHKVNTFPGRGLLIPIEVFQDIGLYDSKNFPQTVADLDFTARADRAGYEIFCNYDARIKIYPDESAGILLRKNKSWANYFHHLFGIKGGANLKWFIKFTFKNAPLKYRTQYLCKGIIVRVFGYPKDWIMEILS